MLLLACLAAQPAAAQLIEGWETKQGSFERLDNNLVIFVSEVEIVGVGPNAGQQIFADEVRWNILTGEFEAKGNVLLVSPTTRLSAEQVVFNTKTGLGTFHTASGLASLGDRGVQDRSMFGALEPDIYFYGKTIEKIGVDKYRITDGSFTSCVQPTPRWEIVTGRATINLDDYAILRNAVVRVKDVPVFYLPVMYYPIQSDGRATGFLLPTYGTSTYRGSSLSNAFFWAINRSQDATFFHDWYTRTGQGVGTEYRYVAGPQSEGQFRAYWLSQKEAEIEVPGGTTLTPAGRSYEVNGSVAQMLPFGLRARGRVQYFSSLQTQQFYNTDIYNMSNRQRTIAGTVMGTWSGVTVTSNFQRSEVFATETSSTVSGFAPSVAATLSSQRISTLPLYVSVNSEASRILYASRDETRENDYGLFKLDATPTLRATLSNWPFLTVNGSVAYRHTYFSESLDTAGVQVPVGLTRRYFDFRADAIGPVFSRVFTPNNALADRLKHVIEPNVSVQRVTNFDNLDRVVTASSSYDYVIGGVTRLNYGLTNRIMVRKAPTDPNASAAASAPRELASVSVTQTYYTDARASQFDTSYQSSSFNPSMAPSNFSPIALTARTSPSALTAATVRLEFDHQQGVVQSFSATGNSNYRAAQVSVGWSSRRYTETVRENAINASSTINLLDGRTGGTYTLNWDVTRGYIIQQRWTGFYNAQCCGLGVEYQEYNLANSLLAYGKDRRFNLSFTLAGIGTFANFFGAFGGRSY